MTRIACLLPETPELVPTGALIQLALAHSPRVEDAVTCIYLDAAGLEGLFGAEPELGARLRDAALAVGLSIRVGFAGGRLAAQWAEGERRTGQQNGQGAGTGDERSHDASSEIGPLGRCGRIPRFSPRSRTVPSHSLTPQCQGTTTPR